MVKLLATDNATTYQQITSVIGKHGQTNNKLGIIKSHSTKLWDSVKCGVIINQILPNCPNLFNLIINRSL